MIEVQPGIVRGGKIGRAAQEPGDAFGGLIEHLARRGPAGDALRVGRKRLDVGLPVGGQVAAVDQFELRGQFGVFGLVPSEHCLPFCVEPFAARADALAEIGQNLARHHELLVFRPAISDLRQADLLLAQRRPVGVVAVGLVRATETDHAANDNQRRPIGVCCGMSPMPCGAQPNRLRRPLEARSSRSRRTAWPRPR